MTLVVETAILSFVFGVLFGAYRNGAEQCRKALPPA